MRSTGWLTFLACLEIAGLAFLTFVSFLSPATAPFDLRVTVPLTIAVIALSAVVSLLIIGSIRRRLTDAVVRAADNAESEAGDAGPGRDCYGRGELRGFFSNGAEKVFFILTVLSGGFVICCLLSGRQSAAVLVCAAVCFVCIILGFISQRR